MKEITNIIPQKAFRLYSSFLKGCLFTLLITSLCLFSNCKNDNNKNGAASDDVLASTSMQTKCKAKSGGGSEKMEYFFKSANSGDSKKYTYSSSNCSGSVDLDSIETKPFQYNRVSNVPIKVDGNPATGMQITIVLGNENVSMEMYYVSGADSGKNADVVYVSDGDKDFSSYEAVVLLPSQSHDTPETCGYDLTSFDFRLHTPIPAYYLPKANTITSFSESFHYSSGKRWAIINLKDVSAGDKLVFSFDPRLATSLKSPN